jgi:hypothetical protein
MEEYKYLNPNNFGLNSRTKIVQISDNKVGILKLRKTRIIMKDGEQIAEIASRIKDKLPQMEVCLIISGPICSKTVKFLNNNEINISSN